MSVFVKELREIEVQAGRIRKNLIAKSEEALQFQGVYFGDKVADAAERKFHLDRIERLSNRVSAVTHSNIELADTPRYSYMK